MTRSVDVLIPCYRYGHFLEQCVESVLTQSDVDVRVLILDDASPDHTEEVGRELESRDKRVTFRRHAQNKGHIATYNEGIEWASAEFVLLLSADDYLLTGALGRSARLMEKSPDVGFTFGNGVVLRENGSTDLDHPLGRTPPVRDDGTMTGLGFIAINGSRNLVPAPTAVVRTQLQKRLGGYRPELPHSGDLEMWLRLAAHTSVGFVNDFQAVYRRHEGNMSLQYSSGYMLPDLQGKKAALDFFFRHCSAALTNCEDVRGKLFRDLGYQAIGRASVAFNDGNLEFTEKIASFALSVAPDVGRSLPWAKLACKRALGVAGWRAVNSVRQFATKPRSL